MKAGRELDALVAEKVMGFDVVRDAWDTRSQNELTPKYDLGIRRANGTVDAAVPYFSRRISDAWWVVEKMVADGRVFIVKGDGLRTQANNPKWTVLCDNHPRVDAETAPLAISLAALRVLGVEVPE